MTKSNFLTLDQVLLQLEEKRRGQNCDEKNVLAPTGKPSKLYGT